MEKIEASLRPKVEEAVKVVAEMGQDKLRFTETLCQNNFDRRGLLSLDECKEKLAHSVNDERKKIDVLELLIHKLRFTDNVYQKKPIDACLSAAEIKKHNLHFRMVHESKSLAAEKRLLKEIKESQKQEEDDSFASFCTKCEADAAYATKEMEVFTGYRYSSHSRNQWLRYLLSYEHNWWLQHQMPFLISEGDTKDGLEEIRYLRCRIERCGVTLLKKTDKTADDISPTLVKKKTNTCLLSKKELHEKIKLCGKKIEESRKTKLAISRQTQRNLVNVEKEMISVRKKFPGIARRKNEAHHCIYEIITNQLA